MWKALTTAFCARFLCNQQLPFFIQNRMKFMVSLSRSLNLMGILQEKLVKRMRSLWKLREEMQISLNQEANKTQSFEVRIKMFQFICIDIDIILDFRPI